MVQGDLLLMCLDTEKNYAVIEKEALGVTWGCERLDHFIRGMAFTVETDHKPLVPLISIRTFHKFQQES